MEVAEGEEKNRQRNNNQSTCTHSHAAQQKQKAPGKETDCVLISDSHLLGQNGTKEQQRQRERIASAASGTCSGKRFIFLINEIRKGKGKPSDLMRQWMNEWISSQETQVVSQKKTRKQTTRSAGGCLNKHILFTLILFTFSPIKLSFTFFLSHLQLIEKESLLLWLMMMSSGRKANENSCVSVPYIWERKSLFIFMNIWWDSNDG